MSGDLGDYHDVNSQQSGETFRKGAKVPRHQLRAKDIEPSRDRSVGGEQTAPSGKQLL